MKSLVPCESRKLDCVHNWQTWRRNLRSLMIRAIVMIVKTFRDLPHRLLMDTIYVSVELERRSCIFSVRQVLMLEHLRDIRIASVLVPYPGNVPWVFCDRTCDATVLQWFICSPLQCWERFNVVVFGSVPVMEAFSRILYRCEHIPCALDLDCNHSIIMDRARLHEDVDWELEDLTSGSNLSQPHHSVEEHWHNLSDTVPCAGPSLQQITPMSGKTTGHSCRSPCWAGDSQCRDSFCSGCDTSLSLFTHKDTI